MDDPNEATRAVRSTVRMRQLLRAAARLMERNGAQAMSMQALADEASVSVGLVYRYFSNKEELLLAIIVEVLDTFARRVPAAIEAAGDDPVLAAAAAFVTYCEVIDEHRYAALLTYRESKSLGAAGKQRIKELEIETSDPLRRVIGEAITSGRLIAVDTDLVTYNLLLLAHAWALKYWYFERNFDLETYVRSQMMIGLGALVAPEYRDTYLEKLRNVPVISKKGLV